MNYIKKKAEITYTNDKIDTLLKADAHTGMCVDVASAMGLSVSTLNTLVKTLK